MLGVNARPRTKVPGHCPFFDVDGPCGLEGLVQHDAAGTMVVCPKGHLSSRHAVTDEPAVKEEIRPARRLPRPRPADIAVAALSIDFLVRHL